jgi:MerR family transcriptional regulator/heat shock protein HspR
MSAERRKGVYMISAVAELFGIHPQTLRLYEREGLLRPSRTDGNTRVYTDEDLEQLQTILNLRELGVNLAGVDIILNMRAKMQRMQEEITQFTEFIHRELSREDNALSERAKNALVRLPRREIVPAGTPADAGAAGGASSPRPAGS